jgi:hypothetical protein
MPSTLIPWTQHSSEKRPEQALDGSVARPIHSSVALANQRTFVEHLLQLRNHLILHLLLQTCVFGLVLGVEHMENLDSHLSLLLVVVLRDPKLKPLIIRNTKAHLAELQSDSSNFTFHIPLGLEGERWRDGVGFSALESLVSVGAESTRLVDDRNDLCICLATGMGQTPDVVSVGMSALMSPH